MSENGINKGKIVQIIGPVLDIDFSGVHYHLFIMQWRLRGKAQKVKMKFL